MAREKLYITQAVYNEIIAHAREGKPREVCGILRGRDARVLGLVREGDVMAAIYHSHPVSPAYPSASDAWNANYPECAYVIRSLEDDGIPAVRAFRMIEHGLSLDLEALRAALDLDETRPGRFGYYQAVDVPLPSVLQDACAHIAAPFYIVFESSGDPGKNPETRVVSITEYEIQIVSE
jgi:proteasome lid subunit RPN8/RPN11